MLDKRILAEEEPEWQVDATKCDGCGDCVAVCPIKVLKMVKSVPVYSDRKNCCEEACQRCASGCRSGAISRPDS